MKRVLTVFLIPVVIFIANAALVWPFFLGGYTQQMGSIESVFIADARFIAENFPHFAWNPYWYTGFPFHLFYTPLLPFLMALSHALYSAISVASWYRIYIGLFYALTPVSFYFLVRYLTGRSLVGFLAAMFFSFFPSVSYLMSQLGSLAVIYEGAPWRLLTLVLYGEGGHIVGLFFLPLSLLFFIKTVRDATRENVFWTAIFTGLLALSNMIALIGFAVMLVVALVIESIGDDWVQKLGRAVIAAIFSFGVVAFWYNLSFIKASFSIGTGGVSGGVGDVYSHSLPLIFLLAPVIFVLMLPAKKKSFKPIITALSWIAIFFASAYFWDRDQTMFLPQPNRYLPEMDMGTAFLISWTVTLFLEKIFSPKLSLIKNGFYILFIIASFFFPLRYFQPVQDLIAPNKDIEQTPEYQTAKWLEDNSKGERIYASGTTAFWLNTFTNVPQIRGGNDGVANPWVLHGVYQINTGDNAPKGKEGMPAADWLRIFNVSYLVVNTPSSPVAYHDFKFPERFLQIAGVEEVGEIGGDIIYKVPLNQSSLAQIVRKTDFDSLQVLKNGIDMDNLETYTNYIDNSGTRKAEFSWESFGQAKIEADVRSGEGVAVQVSYDPGWRASVGGKKIDIAKDVVGFMFLNPDSQGKIEINLSYGRTWDVWLGYLLTILSFIGLVFYPKRKPQKAKLPVPAVEKEEIEDE